jgi:uncharacterized protein (TIGR00304 family)
MMTVSVPMLLLGFSLTAVGTVMLFLSFRRSGGSDGFEHRGAGVIFIGPIPIILGGKGKLAILWVLVVAVIALMLMIASMFPDIIGW